MARAESSDETEPYSVISKRLVVISSALGYTAAFGCLVLFTLEFIQRQNESRRFNEAARANDANVFPMGSAAPEDGVEDRPHVEDLP